MSEQDENENKEIRCRELLALMREEHTLRHGSEKFYKLFYPIIFTYFRKQSVNSVLLTKEEAEDLTQEALLKIIYQIDKTNLKFLKEPVDDGDNIKYVCWSWIKRVCFHKFLAKFGKPKPDESRDGDDPDIEGIGSGEGIHDPDETEAQKAEDHDCFMTILDFLRKKYINDYELILLVTLGYSNEEIGKLLGKKKNVIAARKHEAINRLRELAYRHCLQEKAPES